MTQQAMTVEQMNAAIEAVKEHGSVSAAATATGIARTTLQARYTRAVARGLDSTIVGPIPTGHVLKGVSTHYAADGRVLSQWVKDKTGELTFEELTDAIQGAFEDWKGTGGIGQTLVEPTYSDLMTLYTLPDLHIGLLSWRHETDVDWDLSIAKAVIGDTMRRLIALSPPSGRCVILGLGDLLHSDGYENLTPKSKNILDVDGRWPKVLRTAVWVIIQAIELALEKHQHVDVRILPGNHDPESAFAVSLALAMRYEGHPRVHVDDSEAYFWWYEFGKTLLGATHGDKAKMEDLPLIMAQRRPEAWGRTKFRAIFTGHIHKQTGIEKSGVTVESFRTPVAPDSFHTGMGYNAGRTMTSITYHVEDGEIGRVRQPVKDRPKTPGERS